MAILQVCSVLDMVAQQYGRPFFTISEGSAIRGFSDEVNNPSESVLYRHPADFQLFHVGTFDDELCAFTLHEYPKLMVSGGQVQDRSDQAGAVSAANGTGTLRSVNHG